MAVAGALTSLSAARVDSLSRVKLSANWMAAAGYPGEDAALFDTVRAVALDLCPQLGISIPVGKDSLSMRTIWEEGGEGRTVVAPLSLIVSAFAPCEDVRATLTPQLRTDCGATELVLIDLGCGRNRLGGSMLAQVFGQFGDLAPDLDEPGALARFFDVLQALAREGLVLAYHDRSDGGLFATICEMAFAGRTGVTLDAGAPAAASAERGGESLLAALFAEELGAVIQVRATDRSHVLSRLRESRLEASIAGILNADDMIRVVSDGKPVLEEPRTALQRAWSEVSFRMQSLRDNPDCAREEHERILDAADPGLHAHLGFKLLDEEAEPEAGVGSGDRVAAFAGGARPRIAVLREQGVNGQVEMAAAFDRAGFEAHDVHMSDIVEGRLSLAGFHGFAAAGGFSYGDVLGGGAGWARSILFNARARDEFGAFFARGDSFALGVCNGCQMMSQLRELIPGAADWPRFVQNRSEQFEARLAMVEVTESPSMFFAGMAGSRLPIATAHGEGRARFDQPGSAGRAIVALRYVDNRGAATEAYPYNPSGSPQGTTGLTTADGRFTILMPHPERVFLAAQHSWHPQGWGEEGPWMRLFRNARRWVG